MDQCRSQSELYRGMETLLKFHRRMDRFVSRPAGHSLFQFHHHGSSADVSTTLGQTNPAHTRTPDPDSSALAEGYYAATNLNSIDPDLSPENIKLGTNLWCWRHVGSGGTATPADVVSGKTFFGFGQSNWTVQIGTAGNFACSPGFCDLNGLAYDECEFQLDAEGIYVSANDPSAEDTASSGLGPVGTGFGNRPCRSIAWGIQRAAATAAHRTPMLPTALC